MGNGNGLIYLGSFSKVLFPGLRVGWIIADAALIDYLESMKRARSIHTSTLDQSLLYQYLSNGNFEKYLKRARTEYKRKYELVVHCLETTSADVSNIGAGGLHLFVQFPPEVRTRELLAECKVKVTFTPGDTFTWNPVRTSHHAACFSRVSDRTSAKASALSGKRLLA